MLSISMVRYKKGMDGCTASRTVTLISRSELSNVVSPIFEICEGPISGVISSEGLSVKKLSGKSVL